MPSVFTVEILEHNRWHVLNGDEFYTELSYPEVRRVIEHLLNPEIGQHKFNVNKLCLVCDKRSSENAS